MTEEPTPPSHPLPTDWPELDDPTLLEKFVDIIANEGAVDRTKVVPQATLESLGLESIDVVMILMGVEDKLGIYLPMDSNMSSARNLSEFVASIAHAMKSNAATEPPKTE